MHTLLVVAHPDPQSLTHHIGREVEAALDPSSVEVADLAAEGFDPRFTLDDRRAYSAGRNGAADIVREQQRLDRATDLVLIFPVYWWSMPALLKGWIDRVFIAGWAFDTEPKLQPKLQHLTTHLLPVAGDAPGTYDRHGYETSFRTQIEHGILDYCGSPRGATAFVHESEQDSAEARTAAVDAAVRTVSDAILARAAQSAD